MVFWDTLRPDKTRMELPPAPKMSSVTQAKVACGLALPSPVGGAMRLSTGLQGREGGGEAGRGVAFSPN